MKNATLKTTAEPVTQEVFNHLPGLLSPAQFRMVTGLDKRDLETLRENGTIQVFKMPKRKGAKRAHCKYYKTDAAKLTKFKL